MQSVAPPGRRTTTRLLGAAIVAALAVGTGALIANAPWSEAAPPRPPATLSPNTPFAPPANLPAAPPTNAPKRVARNPQHAGTQATRLSTFWGVDVSWPQCDGIPSLAAGFAIVGVNGGRPFTDNPCLGQQVAYAKQRSGYSAYLNLDAPRGEDPKSYGARRSPRRAGARKRAGCTCRRSGSTSKSSTTGRRDAATNVGVINGAATALQSTRLTVGLYSSVPMWQDITGGASVTMPVWLATSVIDYRDVQPLCKTGLGGRPAEMAQYVASANGQLIDIDVLCNNAIPDVVGYVHRRQQLDDLR